MKFTTQAEHRARANRIMGKAGYAVGGDVAQDKRMVDAAVHKHESALHKGQPRTKLATGGAVGMKRGGRTKKPALKVNIVNVPGAAGAPAMAPKMPMPMAPPGMGPAGGQPPMKRGGAVTYARGGKVYKSFRDMDAGAASGDGRLEKTEIQKRKKNG